MNKKIKFISVLFLIIFLSLKLSAVTRLVSLDGNNISPYTNWASAATDIQSAIDICTDGDIVIISNGMYSIPAQVMLTNAAITLKSLNGKDSVVINAGGTQSGIYARDSVIDGLTISNGYHFPIVVQPGGGVNLNRATMKNSRIIDCSAQFGGGFFGTRDSLVENCEIIGNDAERAGGGALITEGAKVIDCSFIGNTVTDSGHVTNLYFGGGGVLLFNGGYISDCSITGNTCMADGGGVYIVGSGTVERCILRNNISADDGGGVIYDNGGFLQSCLIIDNIASNGGGAFFLTNGVLQNCTVSDNSAINGGGVFFDSGGDAINSILFYNNASSGSNYFVSGDASFLYCVTQPSVSNVFADGGNATNLPEFCKQFNRQFPLNAIVIFC